MSKGFRAFTLLELMLVVAIMGLMGTVSVGGYRAMRRGMEDRGVMQNVNQFIRNAYQRAAIDRQPTAVYFWNETRRDESDDGSESLLVVGHAVAVRRSGRVSCVNGRVLYDEFGDLRFYRATDDEGQGDEEEDGVPTFLYRMNGDESKFQRSLIYQTTVRAQNQSDIQNVWPMLTDSDWSEKNKDAKLLVYGYRLKDAGGISWKAGDAYGFAFADMTLPNNYIFGSSFSKNTKDPIQKLDKVLRFSPTQTPSDSVSVYAIRPGASGEPQAQVVDDTKDALKDLDEQNK